MQWTKQIITLGLIVLNLLMYGHNGEKEGGNKSEKPVKKAVVYYGDDFLFNSIENLTDEKIQEFHDSLCALPQPPVELISSIKMFLSVKTMTRMEVAFMLDSLFEAGDHNYALINQINHFIQDHDFDSPTEYAYTKASFDYPANNFYGSWSSSKPHPYSIKLWEKDTLVKLLLADKKLGNYHSPVDKIVVTSHYGYRWDRSHRGIDLDLQVWDTVRAAFKGKVRFVGYYGGYGRVIVIRHYNGLETLYAHLHRYKVKVNDEVDAGQLIGLGGSSGQSTGSHLHFECRFKGVAINPEQIINFEEKKLIDPEITLLKNKWGYVAIPNGVTYYTVKRGDYLYGIAERFGTTCNQICKMNGIRRNSTLKVGQKLRIL